MAAGLAAGEGRARDLGTPLLRVGGDQGGRGRRRAGTRCEDAEQALAAAEPALGRDALAAARTEGEALDVHEAVDEALAWLAQVG
jgi:hypothetical protein